MDEHLLWQRQALMQRAADKLSKNGFMAYCASSADDALQKALTLIMPGHAVALGGSMTLKALRLEETLRQRGQNLVVTKPGSSFEESIAVRRQALLADVYLASPNAVTLDGGLVFVDKIGNRAAGMMFGPRQVIALAGVNKIVADEAAGRARVAECAGPANTKRLNLKTPCATSGICSDCNSPDRICNVFVTLRRRPSYTDYHVVLIPAVLGY